MLGRVTWGLGGGRRWGGGQSPGSQRPKLIPEWDGMYWRVRGRALAVALSEVSGACRGLSFVLEALWRSGRVYIYRDLRAELLQLSVYLGLNLSS